MARSNELSLAVSRFMEQERNRETASGVLEGRGAIMGGEVE